MKSLMNTLILIPTLLMALSTYAQEGVSNGGGGGGVCINQKCMSLTEAGFRVTAPDYGIGFEVDPETIDQLDYISNVAPGLLIRAEDVVQRGQVVMVDFADPLKSKKFLDEYKALLNSQGETDLANSVDLLAFSAEGKTYIIKSKYEAMSARSKALLLIHERSIRKGAPLKYALHFDAVLLEAIQAIDAGKKPDNISLLIAASGIAIHPETAAGLLWGEIVHLSGGVMDTRDLFSEEVEYHDDVLDARIETNYTAILRARKVYPKISQLIARPGWIKVLRLGQRGAVLGNTIWSFRNSDKTFLMNSKTLKQELSREQILGFSKCGNFSDRKSVLVAAPEFQSDLNTFYKIGYANCNASLTSTSWFPFGGPEVFADINGISVPTKKCRFTKSGVLYPTCKD